MGIMGVDILRSGHRYQAMNRVIKRKIRGGSRTIKPVCKSRFQLHNDVIEIKQDRIQHFLTKCNNNNEYLDKFDMADIEMDDQTFTNNINLWTNIIWLHNKEHINFTLVYFILWMRDKEKKERK